MSSTEFSHRFNRDGTVDSICRRCFRTIATAETEAALQPDEDRHVCEPSDVLRFYLDDPSLPDPKKD